MPGIHFTVVHKVQNLDAIFDIVAFASPSFRIGGIYRKSEMNVYTSQFMRHGDELVTEFQQTIVITASDR